MPVTWKFSQGGLSRHDQMVDGRSVIREDRASKATTGFPTAIGFPPIARTDARILILGSLPGKASLAACEYYAHPQNAFWKIMRILCGAEGSYRARGERLMDRGIAVWDVLANSVRPGSMDADIRIETAKPNDFERFLSTHDRIGLVCFNGKKAEQLFRRLVTLDGLTAKPQLVPLPSTSPAYASLSFNKKLAAWRNAIARAEPEERR